MSFIIYSIFKLEVCMLWKLSSLLIELFSRKLIWWGEFKFIKTNTRSQYLANRIFDTQTSSYFQQEAVFFSPICASGYLPLISRVRNIWTQQKEWKGFDFEKSEEKQMKFDLQPCYYSIKKKYFPYFQRRIRCKKLNEKYK